MEELIARFNDFFKGDAEIKIINGCLEVTIGEEQWLFRFLHLSVGSLRVCNISF